MHRRLSAHVGRVGVVAAAILGTTAALASTDAPPAGAHATLTGTAPTADQVIDAVPEQVELRFDEPVEVTDGAVQVFGPDGDRVDLDAVDTADGGATLRAALDDGATDQGTYTVAWRVTSQDSHTLTGSFVFHNGTDTGAVDIAGQEPDTATELAGALGRWLGFAGTIAAAGAAAVALLHPRRPDTDQDGLPLPDHGPVPGSSPPQRGGTATLTSPATATATTGPDVADRVTARLRLVTLVGALVGAAGTSVALVAMLAESAGRSLGDALSLVPDLAPETQTGQYTLARIALGLGAGAAAAVPAIWRRSSLPALVLASAALFAASLAGHAWTAPNRWVAVASDMAHVGAVAVWVGGVLALLVVLPLLTSDGRVRLATRFSGLALGAAIVVAVSGVVSGWQQVGAVDALFSTTYGQLLLLKVGGFGVLVVLGWVNRARLVPLVGRTVAPLEQSLRIETGVAVLVLAVTAVIVQQPPARSVVLDEPFDTTATAASGQVVDATVDPAAAGANDIHLYFYAASGTEPLAVDAVQVTASTTDVPARRLQVTPVTADHVTVAAASLPSPGTWTVEVTAVQAGEPLVFTFEVPIA